MKTFKEYLTESQEDRKYSFKIKIAGDLPENCEDVMKTIFKKYECCTFNKVRTTPIQSKLTDFPQLENVEVTIFEADFEYPTTSSVLSAYISENTGITADRIKVRSPKEEAEAELNAENSSEDTKKKALLTQDYEKENNQSLVGDKKVSNFLKELQKARSEIEQYKGVNDQILAKKAPKEKPSAVTKETSADSPLSKVTNPDLRKGI